MLVRGEMLRLYSLLWSWMEIRIMTTGHCINSCNASLLTNTVPNDIQEILAKNKFCQIGESVSNCQIGCG